MNGEELRRRYATGERNFSGLNLRGVNISGISPDLDLAAYDELCPEFAADLSGINLSGANLRGAILAGSNLTNANLSNANLMRAALDGCNLTKTNLSNANLTRAILNQVDLEGTNMRGANLLYAEISGAYFRPTTDMRGARNVKTVDFTGTPIHGLVLEDGTIIDSDHDW